MTRFLLPVDRHSTVFGGNRGQGLLAIPHGPDLAPNCARGRLAGPLSWLQVQGREEPATPFQQIYGHVRGLGGRNRPAQSNSTAKSVLQPLSRRARRPQVHVERECPDRAKSRFPIRENGHHTLLITICLAIYMVSGENRLGTSTSICVVRTLLRGSGTDLSGCT